MLTDCDYHVHCCTVNNAAVDVLSVAGAMLDGEVDYHAGNHAAAFEHLRTAVRLDDALNYS